MQLREYLRLQGMTAAQFARQLEVSESTVQRWLRHQSQPSLEALARIEAVTHSSVTVHDFVGLIPRRREVKTIVCTPKVKALVEDWCRQHGIKAVSMMLKQAPGGPTQYQLTRYLLQDERPRWEVKRETKGRPSIWHGSSALDVHDSLRILCSLCNEEVRLQSITQEAQWTY